MKFTTIVSAVGVLLSSRILAQSIDVTSSGVGIGTSSPSAKLEVKGPSSWQGTVRVNAGVGEYSSFGWMIGDSVKWSVYVHPGTTPANGLVFANASGNDRVTYSQDGNVGIGTTSPARTLEVAGSIYSNVAGGGALELNGNNSNSQPSIYFERSGTGVWSMGLTSDANASFYINNGYGGGNVITMTAAGNVGIGTGSPGYKLQVSGSVRATSFVADVSTYSDFVFKPSYRLASLAEVEAAITKDGHLPEIPSETEAKAKGINLAEMQVKLLQKVEELTLYLIEQNKRLDRQQHEIDRLKGATR